jgi:hypothetical protein
MKFDIGDLHKNLSRKSKCGYGWWKTLGILYEDLSTMTLLTAVQSIS